MKTRLIPPSLFYESWTYLYRMCFHQQRRKTSSNVYICPRVLHVNYL